MNILITGGNGYIAKSISYELKSYHNVTTISRKDFDLTNKEATDNFFSDKIFDVVIHCAVKGGSRLKKDSWEDMDDNLKMYYNLLDNKNKFHKFIHFGSGAEIHSTNTPYGLSKKVIRESIQEKQNFYNLRIFGVFDENELETRFIKSNINRYINKKPIEIYEDKYMDFIYMKDLLKIINYYINKNDLPKDINCTYNSRYTLTKIADIINHLDTHRVEINIANNRGQDYIGDGINILVDFIGLESGIKEVYKKIIK